MMMISRRLLQRALLVLLVLGIAVTGGHYVKNAGAENPKPEAAPAVPLTPEQEKLKAEYTKAKKEKYLEMVKERKRYYEAMAGEMESIYKACEGDDRESCKKAKKHAQEVREKHKQERKKDAQQFKEKTKEYREKMGFDDEDEKELKGAK